VDVMAHALEWMKKNRNMDFDYAMILQPTSPLRKAEDIDACINIAEERHADSVMSMMHIPDFAVEKLKTIDDGLIKPLIRMEGKDSAHRTEGTMVYKRNTAIYLTRSDLLRVGEMFGKVSYAYVMPMERSVDINEQADIELAEFFLKKHANAS
jgi:CMP-N-acetylneuraminic acid synthetase